VRVGSSHTAFPAVFPNLAPEGVVRRGTVSPYAGSNLVGVLLGVSGVVGARSFVIRSIPAVMLPN
jgi:hypothetical protein